jgi:hypothetical protein
MVGFLTVALRAYPGNLRELHILGEIFSVGNLLEGGR